MPRPGDDFHERRLREIATRRVTERERDPQHTPVEVDQFEPSERDIRAEVERLRRDVWKD